MLTVGQFTYDAAKNTVAGPADYMDARGSKKLDTILSGNDAAFNIMLTVAPPKTDIEALVLVALHTDFAGWQGARQFAARYLR